MSMTTRQVRRAHKLSRSAAVAIHPNNRDEAGIRAYKESPAYAEKQKRRAKHEARAFRQDRTPIYNNGKGGIVKAAQRSSHAS